MSLIIICPKMATNVVSEYIIYRTGVVFKTTRNLISVEWVWDIILSKLLFHTKPHHPSISWPFSSKSIQILSFHTDTKSYGVDTVLKKRTTSIFRQPPKDTSSISLWNTASQTTCNPNLDQIMFFHHCENLK